MDYMWWWSIKLSNTALNKEAPKTPATPKISLRNGNYESLCCEILKYSVAQLLKVVDYSKIILFGVVILDNYWQFSSKKIEILWNFCKIVGNYEILNFQDTQ